MLESTHLRFGDIAILRTAPERCEELLAFSERRHWKATKITLRNPSDDAEGLEHLVPLLHKKGTLNLVQIVRAWLVRLLLRAKPS